MSLFEQGRSPLVCLTPTDPALCTLRLRESQLRGRVGRSAGGVAGLRARGGGGRPGRGQAHEEGGEDPQTHERLHGLGQGGAQAAGGREPRPPQRGPLQDAG